MLDRVSVRRCCAVLVAVLFAIGCDDSGGGGDPDPDAMGGAGGGDGDAVDMETPPGDMGVGGADGGDGDGPLPADMGCPTACECGQVQDPTSCECSDDPDGCAEDCDCVGDGVCNAGACELGCTDDDACAAIDPTAPTCFEGRCGNCAADEDCYGESTCGDDLRCRAADPCSDTRECAGLRCADDDCVEALGCGEGDCPEGWSCDASGECVAIRGRCRQAVECPLGLTCAVSQQPAACGRCANDGDCPGAQACELGSGRCVETGCVGDGDCVLGRTCVEGRCEAPACEDDNFEPNQTFDEARELAGGVEHRNLGGCDDDWFFFEIPARHHAVVALRQDGFGGNLDLEVYGADRELISGSRTGNQTEAASAGPFGSARPIYVRVWQPGPPSSVGYTVSIDLLDRERWAVDGWEGGGGDDSIETGRIVRRGGEASFAENLRGSLCPGDVDYFCFQMGSQEQLAVSAEVVGGNATLVGVLVDDEGAEVEGGEGRWPRGRAGVDIDLPASGFLCLRLEADGPVDYELHLDAIPRPVRVRCGPNEGVEVELDDLVDGLYTDDDELDGASAFAPRCAPQAGAGERVYHFDQSTVEAGSMLVARVIGLPGGTLGDPVVSARSDCVRANTELGCGDDTVEAGQPLLRQPNPAVVRVPVMECPRDCDDPDDPCHCVSVIVDGIDPGDAPSYRLEVTTRPLSAAPRNDRCADPIALDVSDGSAGATASLDRAADDVSACLGAGGPDTVYSLTLESTSRVTVQTASIGDDFAVGAYLVRRCGDEAMACGFGFDQVVEAGEYLLVVDGADANARGRVEVQVAVEAFDSPPENDTCDDAVALDAVGGEVEGDTRSAADDFRLADGNGCTGHDTRGGDVVYTIPVGDVGLYFVEAEPHGGWDLSLMVLGDCDDPLDDCVGEDGALTETVLFARNGGGDVTVVVDGSGGEAGEFTLRWGPAECADDEACNPGQRCVAFQCVD